MPFVVDEPDSRQISFFHPDRAFRRYDPLQAPSNRWIQAKASGKVCVRIPHAKLEGRRASRVWDVPATFASVTDLATELVAERIERVTVESTSDYWRIWFHLLEAAGLRVQLVNARDVKMRVGSGPQASAELHLGVELSQPPMLRHACRRITATRRTTPQQPQKSQQSQASNCETQGTTQPATAI